MSLLHDWPLFGLRVETPRLSLSHPTDADLEVLNAVIDQGIHDPAFMPFEQPFTDEPPEIRPRHSLQHWWRVRASWEPEKWMLTMMVKEGQTVVGVQDLVARNFSLTREVQTGSWLGRQFQGRGIGKEMRSAILHLAFAGLGAQRAASGAFEDNIASIRVSRAIGYVENGDEIKVRRGKPARIPVPADTSRMGKAAPERYRDSWTRAMLADVRIGYEGDVDYLKAACPVISSPMASR